MKKVSLRTSVVISTYNGERFIIEQLESIRKQTVLVDEVIISDDGSNDNTVGVINEYLRTYGLNENWSISVNRKNKGWIQNFHDLLYMAHNDIVFLCDQDDIWFSDKVEKMLNVMEHNKAIKCLAASFEPYFMDGEKINLPNFYKIQMLNDGILQKIQLTPKTVHLMAEGCTMCVRKEFLLEVQKYWFSGWTHEEFLWKTALCKDGMYKINIATLHRRLHSNNVSRQGMRSAEKRIRHLTVEYESFKVMSDILQGTTKNDKNSKLLEDLLRMSKLRIELIKNKAYINLLPLAAKYITLYQNKKSYFAELLIAVKS